ncbi:MAG TPA: P63C domain-containing protein [Candidatus Acidoferrum sp.]|nr:P63C domain-containing protein [Candidatus Acidoferrum sp.]
MKNSDDGASGKVRSGRARMASLSPEEKREFSRRGASSRWEPVAPNQVIHEPEAWGELPIGGHSVPCAVLMIEGEVIRVVSDRGLIKSFGGKRGGSHWLRTKQDASIANLPAIISAPNLREFISGELREGLNKRYPYKVPGRNGMVAHGIRGDLYPMICDVFLKARDNGKLLLATGGRQGQEDMARAADIMMRALAHTGIIALIDEVTGYQSQRPPDALTKILEAFIAKELQPYVKTFPSDFYEHLFRLRGLNYKTDSVERPLYFGCLTNDIVYKRLAPGVLAELKKVTLRNEAGRPKHKYFQRLTQNLGYPKLREHLGGVVAIMKLSSDYKDFLGKLDRLCPRYGQMYLLPIEFDPAKDTGSGL